MRMNSGKLKLVVVDEPSSALDPEAEWELFQKLRDHKARKTMIFVTHRFGHLTKYADLILSVAGTFYLTIRH
jgi:energy-coupling factor transporter ATP-binding protein EcfA2